MITGTQMRMALAGLKWTHAHLAERAGLHLRTVQRAVNVDGVPDMRSANLAGIQAALESGGVEFGPDSVTCRPGA